MKLWIEPRKTVPWPDSPCTTQGDIGGKEKCDPCGYEYRKLLKEIDDQDESYWIKDDPDLMIPTMKPDHEKRVKKQFHAALRFFRKCEAEAGLNENERIKKFS